MPGYETAIVRLTTPAGVTAGLGVLVGPDKVMTCAHVVNAALSRPEREQAQPDPAAEVSVRFPLIDGSAVRTATIAAWVAPAAQGAGGDVAGLVLGEPAPAAATAARFSTAPATPGERLRVFGFPGTPPRANGAWVDLDLKGEVGNNLIQVESREDQSIKAQPGYSGSAVWSDEAGQIVGLLHATAFADEPERDAYLIPPLTIAAAWEEELDYLAVPPNPYRGLEPFTRDHAHVFFGRDDDIAGLVEMVRTHGVTTLIGPSGVGKSSLAQAGVVPALLDEQPWTVAVFRPGPDPWERLAAALYRAQHPDEATITYEASRQEVRRLRREGIAPVAQFLRSDGRPLLVVVDQFEELLDRERHGDRGLIDLLIPEPATGADADDILYRTLLTLRTDFFDSLLLIPGMSARLSRDFYTLWPLTNEQMHDAMVRPAAMHGVTFEDGLLDVLTGESNEGRMLPLVEFTLTQMWPRMRRKTLTHAEYHALGGVTGALDRFADQQIAALSSQPTELLDRVLLRLVRAVPDADRDEPLIMRRRARKSDVPPEEWEVLQHLANARLVTTDRDAADAPYAELAHESLITAWQRLDQLVADNVRLLNWLTDVERRVSQGDPLPESRLPEALTWLAERPEDIPETVHTFVAESAAAAEEVTRKVRQLEALTEVGEAVGSSLDLDQVLSTIVMSAVRTSRADGGSMMQYDTEGRCFSVRTEFGTAPDLFAKLLDLHVGLDTTLVGRAAREGRALQVSDLAEVERDEHLQLLFDAGWQSIMVAPMLRQDRLIGALVIRRKSAGTFSDENVSLLETFASQSALVIYNADLFQQLEVTSQQLKMVSQYRSAFLASMSHELRTPLNAIIGFSEVLLERLFGDINQRQEEYLRDIWSSGTHLLEIINDAIDLSRLEAGRMELDAATFAVRTSLDSALAEVRDKAAAQGLELTLTVTDEVGEIYADEMRFRQVLLNLLTNAVKFTPSGGHVAVDAHVDGAELVVTVSDDGPGIPEEDQQYLLASFQQSGRGGEERQGTGLGLAVSRRIIELFGGRMWLESVEGEGSTFGFSVPLESTTGEDG